MLPLHYLNVNRIAIEKFLVQLQWNLGAVAATTSKNARGQASRWVWFNHNIANIYHYALINDNKVEIIC